MEVPIESDGRPKYYHNKVYPIDIQCAGQAIDTLTYFAGEDSGALGLAKKVATWTIDTMNGSGLNPRNDLLANRAGLNKMARASSGR